MRQMTLQNIARECGGVLTVPENMPQLAGETVTSVTTDSRQVREGSLFAAIKGERTDGNLYTGMAFEKGALCVLSEEPAKDAEHCHIKVPSTIAALGNIASFYRQVMDIPVVGVTGSVGKTSTKEMIHSVLSVRYNVHKTQGNFNNDLGLPITIFGLKEEHQMAVLELGINHFGEMHNLAGIARPDTCVITNIGPCHLEYLNDLDGVLRAKTEIFDYLDSNASIVLNGDDIKLRSVREVKGIKPVFFGIEKEDGDHLDVWADNIRPLGFKGTACDIHMPSGTFSVTVPVPGVHMVRNALAAACVGMIYSLSADEIRAGIEGFIPVSGRFNIIDTGKMTVIDDCYNANPVSVKASLGVLALGEGHKTAVLGDMFELGTEELSLHREVGSYAGGLGLDRVICIGDMSRETAKGAREAGASNVLHFDDVEGYLEKAGELAKDGDTVLVKASHAMHFEKIVEALKCL